MNEKGKPDELHQNIPESDTVQGSSSGSENLRPSKHTIIRILVPVLIILAVAGIWIFKNMQDKTNSLSPDNPDFALDVTEPLDLDKLKSYGLPILIEFGADWCDPCRQMAPIIKSLNAELQGKAIVKFVNVDNAALAEGYPISVIPTQLFIDSKGNPYTPSKSNPYSMKTYSRKDTGKHVFTTHEGIISSEDLTSVLKEMGMK